MSQTYKLSDFSPTTLAEIVKRPYVMRSDIRPLWTPMPRLSGPAFPVRCGHGEHLMLHAAIYRAPVGSVIVIESADMDFAVAGGNVCAIAQQRGIAGFIVDGAIRDLAEIRQNHFPVFARGITPIPGNKTELDLFNQPITCGDVSVAPGDIIVADEEGIVVIPHAQQEQVLRIAQDKIAKESRQTLAEWESAHRAKVDAILTELDSELANQA